MLVVKVNGEDRRLEEGTSVDGLLERLALQRPGVAVEINREIVPRRRHSAIQLRDGDEVEIVTFVGGG